MGEDSTRGFLAVLGGRVHDTPPPGRPPHPEGAVETSTERPRAMDQFRRWVAIALALATLGYLVYAVWRGWTQTANELATFDWLLYGPVLLLTLVNYGLRYLKWHYLLGVLGIHIPHRVNLGIFATGLAMVISPAKAGEVVKPWLVGEVTGEPATKTVPALIAERGTDGIAVVVLAALGVTTYFADAAELIYGTILIIALVLIAIAVRPIAKTLLGLAGRLPLVGGIADRLDEAYEATRTCLAPVPFAIIMVLSLVAWWAECVGYWLVFVGLGIDAGLDASTFLYAFATVFGAPSPGGMGMADAALAEGATQILEGVQAPQALAAALLIRVATLWFGVLLGALTLLRIEVIIQRGRAAL